MKKLLLVSILAVFTIPFAAFAADADTSSGNCCKEGRFEGAACTKIPGSGDTTPAVEGTGSGATVESPSGG